MNKIIYKINFLYIKILLIRRGYIYFYNTNANRWGLWWKSINWVNGYWEFRFEKNINEVCYNNLWLDIFTTKFSFRTHLK